MVSGGDCFISRILRRFSELNLSFAFQSPYDLDDFQLSGLDLPQLECSQETDFFMDSFRSPFGNAGEQGGLEFVAGGLERHGEVAHIDLAKHLLKAGRIEVEQIFERVRRIPGYELAVDLVDQTIKSDDGLEFRFQVDGFRRDCLLNGLDDIGLTLQFEAKISEFESRAAA